MPFKKTSESELPVNTRPCIYLRSKAIYVTGSLDNPEHPDEDSSHTCWCNLTQHVLGPDQCEVGRSECRPGRQCFRETY